MGMKDIDNKMKIVDKDEAKDLDKNTNVTVISELDNNKFMVRHSGKITDNIRKWYSKDPLILDNNKSKIYIKDKLRKSGFNKPRSVPSAVHIAAAISSYARILINEFKNIPGNPHIMSDTDSVVLPYPLPGHLVGNELGQMKLEHEIKIGIFIRKKFYYILTPDGKEIIKSSGIVSSKLNHVMKWPPHLFFSHFFHSNGPHMSFLCSHMILLSITKTCGPNLNWPSLQPHSWPHSPLYDSPLYHLTDNLLCSCTLSCAPVISQSSFNSISHSPTQEYEVIKIVAERKVRKGIDGTWSINVNGKVMELQKNGLQKRTWGMHKKYWMNGRIENKILKEEWMGWVHKIFRPQVTIFFSNFLQSHHATETALISPDLTSLK